MKIESPEELLEAKLICIKRVRECIDFAKKNMGISIECPQVRFGITSGVGGTADSFNNIIQLNPTLLIYNPKEFFDQVVPHEVSHLLCRKKYPKAGSHGENWKNIMRAFGLKPDVCHSMDIRFMPRNIGNTKNKKVTTIVNNKIKNISGGKIVSFD